MGKKSAQETSPPEHRGRVQAQGPQTEKSESWAQANPPTKAEVLGLLDHVWGRLNDTEQDQRKDCYAAARKYVEQAPRDGIIAPLSKTFRNRKPRGGVRIDIEITTGRAAVGETT